jgi:hypothetical protein
MISAMEFMVSSDPCGVGYYSTLVLTSAEVYGKPSLY